MKVVLIIEDNYSLALEIEMMISKLNGYLPKMVNTFADAKKMLSSLKPDIILSDIFLDDDNTIFDLLDIVKCKAPLVLMTAEKNDEIYEKSKNYDPFIYLIKPFDTLSLRSVLDKLVESPSDNLKANSVYVRSKGRDFKIDLKDLIYIHSEGNYCTLHTTDQQVITRGVLDEIVENFKSRDLVRIHRKYAINIGFIESLDKSTVSLKSSNVLPIGRKYKNHFKDLILH